MQQMARRMSCAVKCSWRLWLLYKRLSGKRGDQESSEKAIPSRKVFPRAERPVEAMVDLLPQSVGLLVVVVALEMSKKKTLCGEGSPGMNKVVVF